MAQNSLDDYTKFTSNRFEAIVVAAKHAREKNELLIELENKPEQVEGEVVKPRMEKIISLALNEVLKGKVKFERPKDTGKKLSK